ncbi:MAG: glycosyltransferase [Coriobacteriia bacterium]|nr:glycosyltransferase [Coriobacteriia bacterium]
MINLVIDQPATRGPGKVIGNLLRGFELIGFEDFIINGAYDQGHDRTYILNAPFELWTVAEFVDESFVLGPNLFVVPDDDASGVVAAARYGAYVQPSEWVASAWRETLPSDKVVVWPVGVDTEAFCDTSEESKSVDVLVYFKHREPELLLECIDILEDLGLSRVVLEYGHYDEDSYRRALASARACVWLGAHESQGLALQEALSSGVPALVWDVRSTAEEVGWSKKRPSMPATAVPYFDERCGERVFSADELRESMTPFLARLDAGEFAPRAYVVENLGLEKQARAFLEIGRGGDA